MIARQLLLDKFKIVRPAVADDDRIRPLTHFCFTGDRLMAFNDRIAISTPRTTDFKGTVPAKRVTDLLSTSRAAVVELVSEGENVLINLGNASIKLASFSPDMFLNIYPFSGVMPKHNFIDGIAGRFFAGIECCMPSVETHAVVKDKLGITIIPDTNALRLYSTNGQTMTKVTLPLPKKNKFKERVILSGEFCTQMLHLAKRAAITRLFIHKERLTKREARKRQPCDYALFVADDTLLFGRLIISESPLDMEKVVQDFVPKDQAKAMVAIPPKLKEVLQRMTRISEIVTAETLTHIIIKDGMATFRSASQRGEISETIPLPGHPDAETRMIVSHLLHALGSFEQVLFQPRCVLLRRGQHLRLISARG